MFVNGYSIYYDYFITNYTYYHIETETRSVIWANNMLTKNYLDKRNQTQFKQHGDFALLIADHDYIEPLYHTLLQRAIKIGLPIMQDKKTNM